MRLSPGRPAAARTGRSYYTLARALALYASILTDTWQNVSFVNGPLPSRSQRPMMGFNRQGRIGPKTSINVTVIGRELHDPAILVENVYNMDETGIVVSRPRYRKVLLHRNDLRGFRGAGSKRMQVTAIECISADGKCLDPLIIWPTSTLRSDWTIHSTPWWRFLRVPQVGTTTVTQTLSQCGETPCVMKCGQGTPYLRASTLHALHP